jgi:hypothetical protein
LCCRNARFAARCTIQMTAAMAMIATAAIQ